MRVSFASKYSTLMTQIFRKEDNLSRLSLEVSTGKRLQRPSDDPVDWARSGGLKDVLRQIDTFEENVDFATGWNNETDSVLNQLNDLVLKARDLGIQSISSDQQDKVAELNQVIEEAVSLSNSEYQGRYIFGGEGSSTTEPFSVVKDSEGNLTSVSDFQSYASGDQWALEVRVGNSQYQTVNLDGRDVFLDDPTVVGSPDQNVFQHMVNLRDAMDAGDIDTIEQEVTALETAQERLTSHSSVVGSRLNTLENRKNMLTSVSISRQEQLSDLEDADLATAITEMQMTQTALDAAFSTASILSKLNLQSYL